MINVDSQSKRSKKTVNFFFASTIFAGKKTHVWAFEDVCESTYIGSYNNQGSEILVLHNTYIAYIVNLLSRSFVCDRFRIRMKLCGIIFSRCDFAVIANIGTKVADF